MTRRVGSVAGVLSGFLLSAALGIPGCGDEQSKTGTLVGKAQGQDTGEQASQDAMKAMMKGGAPAAKGGAPAAK